MQFGNAVERLVDQSARSNSLMRQLFGHRGGPSNPDFVGRGPYTGLNYDITTPRGVGPHLARPYGPGLLIPTYVRPVGFGVFP